jgi:hypothetical protein
MQPIDYNKHNKETRFGIADIFVKKKSGPKVMLGVG